jgi:hypothetical protein
MVGLLVVLLLRVRGGGKVEVSEEQRARALAEYRRRNQVSEVQKPADIPVRRSKKALAGEPPPPAPELADGQRFRKPPRISDRRPARPGPSGISQPTADDGQGGADEVVTGMKQATRYYDKGDYPAALEAALAVLENDPRNIKMLRVVVSTKCALDEVDSARTFSKRLPRRDQRQMRTRCLNWGAEL